MLDFQASPLDSEKRTRTTQIRHGEALGELIARNQLPQCLTMTDLGGARPLFRVQRACLKIQHDRAPFLSQGNANCTTSQECDPRKIRPEGPCRKQKGSSENHVPEKMKWRE